MIHRASADMAKAKDRVKHLHVKKNSSSPTDLKFRFKTVQAKTRSAVNGFKRLYEPVGAPAAHHFILHSAHTTSPKKRQTFSKHLLSWKQTSTLRLCLVPRSVGALVLDWRIGCPPERGHAVCRGFTHRKRNMAMVGAHLREVSYVQYASQKAARDAWFPNVT